MWTYNFISGTLKEASGFRTESVESRTRQKRPFWVAETQSTHYPSIPRSEEELRTENKMVDKQVRPFERGKTEEGVERRQLKSSDEVS